MKGCDIISKNYGKRNEYGFIYSINNKKFKYLNILLQDLVQYLFPKIKRNDVVKCYKNVDYEKGDICIEFNNIKKYVSIKMGHGNSVHGETIETFVDFLKKNKVNDFVINEILNYQYADGTLDGTGKIRLSAEQYKELNESTIDMVNKAINNRKLLNKCINRFIISGIHHYYHPIDVLVYGVPNDFWFITPNEIYEYIISKKDMISSSIHFSNLTFQSQSRVLDYSESKEYMRHWIQIKWYNLEDNIIEILNNRAIKRIKI